MIYISVARETENKGKNKCQPFTWVIETSRTKSRSAITVAGTIGRMARFAPDIKFWKTRGISFTAEWCCEFFWTQTAWSMPSYTCEKSGVGTLCTYFRVRSMADMYRYLARQPGTPGKSFTFTHKCKTFAPKGGPKSPKVYLVLPKSDPLGFRQPFFFEPRQRYVRAIPAPEQHPLPLDDGRH